MALQVTTAATGVVRDAHYVTPTGASAAVRTLLLEPQRTNLCIRSQEFDGTGWSGSATVTADTTIAPDGTVTADLLNATGAGFTRVRTVTFTGDGEKCCAVWLRAGTGAVTEVQINDTTAAVVRHRVRATWTAGVPALTTATGAGTLYPVESFGNGWYRVMFSATGIVAANTNTVAILPGGNAGTGTVLAWGAQAEDAVVPSSYIPTVATTVTRNADSLYWALASLVPREMTVYTRGVNVGGFVVPAFSQTVCIIGSSNINTDPRLRTFVNTTSGNIGTTYDDGTTELSVVAAQAATVLGTVVETRQVLLATGATFVGASADGAAEVVSSTSAASTTPAAFAAARFYIAGSGNEIAKAFTNVAIALGTKTRAEMRSIAGV